jgi:hypothetical protein
MREAQGSNRDPTATCTPCPMTRILELLVQIWLETVNLLRKVMADLFKCCQL